MQVYSKGVMTRKINKKIAYVIKNIYYMNLLDSLIEEKMINLIF